MGGLWALIVAQPLLNLLGKSPSVLFSEFEGIYDLKKLKGSGDVKYHKGFSADLRTASGNVHTVLAFNPSHLEVVNPVVEGSVRARQERREERETDGRRTHDTPCGLFLSRHDEKTALNFSGV